jgi:hypothetical protein
MALDENDKLYVAAVVAGSAGVYEWTGATWRQLGSNFPDAIEHMAVVPNGDLYVGGQFDSSVGGTMLHSLARWNGTSWVDMGGGIEENGYISGMTIYDRKLLVVGNFDEIGGQPAGSVALWDGTAWDTFGGGLPPRFSGGSAPTATAVAAKANGFFIGGTFSEIGSLSVNYIAWWDGQDWHALGAGLSDLPESMTIADYQLIVGGPFTEAGADPSYHVGVWDYRP